MARRSEDMAKLGTREGDGANQTARAVVPNSANDLAGECEGHVPDNPQTFRTYLVFGVLRGVMRRKIEVDDVDRVNPGLL